MFSEYFYFLVIYLKKRCTLMLYTTHMNHTTQAYTVKKTQYIYQQRRVI